MSLLYRIGSTSNIRLRQLFIIYVNLKERKKERIKKGTLYYSFDLITYKMNPQNTHQIGGGEGTYIRGVPYLKRNKTSTDVNK